MSWDDVLVKLKYHSQKNKNTSTHDSANQGWMIKVRCLFSVGASTSVELEEEVRKYVKIKAFLKIVWSEEVEPSQTFSGISTWQ